MWGDLQNPWPRSARRDRNHNRAQTIRFAQSLSLSLSLCLSTSLPLSLCLSLTLSLSLSLSLSPSLTLTSAKMIHTAPIYAASLLRVSVCLPACLPACLSVCLSVCLAFVLSFCLSFCRPVCPRTGLLDRHDYAYRHMHTWITMDTDSNLSTLDLSGHHPKGPSD